MFGLGTGELLLILLLVFLIYGPSRLPELARSLGKAVRDMKNASEEVRDAVTKVPTIKKDEKKQEPPSKPG